MSERFGKTILAHEWARPIAFHRLGEEGEEAYPI